MINPDPNDPKYEIGPSDREMWIGLAKWIGILVGIVVLGFIVKAIGS